MITTTFMQSLELIKAGIDPETADFYYKDTPSGRKKLIWRDKEPAFYLCASEIPAWSLGALWEVVSARSLFEFSDDDEPSDIIASLVAIFIDRQKYNI